MPFDIDPKRNLWGIVLAAGGGNRIRHFIEKRYGMDSPKQYVAFTGKRSMLQHTLHRVETLIPSDRTLVVVDPKHGKDIRTQLYERPDNTVIFQPCNRETAPGVLLPLMHIYKRDPEARVAIFPADHFILEEDRFMAHVSLGDEVVRHHPDQIVLLGVRAEGPETEYGWIEPGEPLGERFGTRVRRLGHFLEKPDLPAAREFFRKGFLWNTFVMVAKAETLIELAKAHLPNIWSHFDRILDAIGTNQEHHVVEAEYRNMERATLSRGILEKSISRMSVIEIEGVFWSDWGSEERVLATLEKIGRLPLPFSEEVRPIRVPRPKPEKEKIAI
ncbi:MAG TPA: sugar phosphate nucleotidyltransferase [Nitrospiria bacterium]|nr:sugar phosphate nucleotidyltransferase [Nitrospiria bacterium]